MSLLGKEALELQLERFFTVWCWSWDLLKKESLHEYFGQYAYDSLLRSLSFLIIQDHPHTLKISHYRPSSADSTTVYPLGSL